MILSPNRGLPIALGVAKASTHLIVRGIAVTQLDYIYIALRPTFMVSRRVGDLDEALMGERLKVGKIGVDQTTMEKVKLLEKENIGLY